MKLYTNATIKITERNNFKNDEGETIEYGIVYLKDNEGGILKVNTGKQDFAEHEGKEGLATVYARDDGGRLKISLVDFKEDATIPF